MNTCILGIDVGTTAVKAVLFDRQGGVRAVAQEEYPTSFPHRGWVEQDPEHWWQAVQQSIRNLISTPHGQAADIVAIGVSSQAPALVPLDKHGNPLDQAMIWMDRRSEPQAEWLRNRIGEEHIFAYSGNRMDPFYTASKLLWFKEHKADKYRNLATIMQVNGYINYKLTDMYSMDAAHASITQLYDVHQEQWAESILGECGIDPSLFPPIYPCSEVIGAVSEQAAALTGLKQGIPVIAGTVDGAAAALEAGVIRPGSAAEMTGTSSVLIVCPPPEHTFSKEFIAMNHALPGMKLELGAMTSTGASLKWLKDQYGLDSYEQMSSLAELASTRNELIFLPYMMGERSPIWDTDARGVFFGLSLHTTRGDMIRATMEGSAYALRHNLDIFKQAGTEISTLSLLGGAARSPLWNQIKADIINLPIDVMEGSGGAPLGNAILAGMAVGLYTHPEDVLSHRTYVQKRVEPNEQLTSFYNQKYAVYLQLYTQIQYQFKQMSSLLKEGNS